MITLEEYESSAIRQNPIRPVWQKGLTEKAILEWFSDCFPTIEEVNRERIERFFNNIMWYTGEYDRTLEYRVSAPGRRDFSLPRKVLPFVINHLYDLTEQRVSSLSAYKPIFEVDPANKQWKDKLLAKGQKMILDRLARINNFDLMLIEAERTNAICGESYVGIEYDKRIGDKKGDERVGDVKFKIKYPWYVFLNPQRRSYGEQDWVIEIDGIYHIDEVRSRYKVRKLEPDRSNMVYGYGGEGYWLTKSDQEAVVYRLTVKPCEDVPNGLEATICNGTILEFNKEKYAYSHEDFYFERYTDIDVPGRLHPISFYQHIKPIQGRYNKMSAMIDRNLTLCAHPKWLMPKGSCNIKSLGNTATVVQYALGQAPQLVTFNSVPTDLFQFRLQVREDMNQLSGSTGISRGDPPPGTRTAKQLAFFEEQEQKRRSTHITKHNDFIRRIIEKASCVVGDYYPANDKDRMLRILGEENEHLVTLLSQAKLSSGYQIVIRNASAFSESKSVRKEEIAFLRQQLPGLLTMQQEADILELGQTDKFYDIATASLKQAEAENELMLEGQEPPEAQEYQDHIVHWQNHLIRMQSIQFEMYTPEPIKELFRDHVLTHEMHMVKKASTNLAFSQMIKSLAGFPVFFVEEVPPPLPMPGLPGMAGGAGAVEGGPSGIPAMPSASPFPEGPPNGSIAPAPITPPPPQVPTEQTPPLIR